MRTWSCGRNNLTVQMKRENAFFDETTPQNGFCFAMNASRRIRYGGHLQDLEGTLARFFRNSLVFGVRSGRFVERIPPQHHLCQLLHLIATSVDCISLSNNTHTTYYTHTQNVTYSQNNNTIMQLCQQSCLLAGTELNIELCYSETRSSASSVIDSFFGKNYRSIQNVRFDFACTSNWTLWLFCVLQNRVQLRTSHISKAML